MIRAAAGALAAAALLAGCGGGDQPASSPAAVASASPSASASATPSGPAPTPGINTRPPGELDAACRALIVDFNDRLSQAYAAGDPSHLGDFLAGVELKGHDATIRQLNAKHLRNIFHVAFDSLSITSNTPQRVVFNLADHTTDNHFVDTTTNQVVNQGFPGPATQSFQIFFDYNPQNQTWYWTSGTQNK